MRIRGHFELARIIVEYAVEESVDKWSNARPPITLNFSRCSSLALSPKENVLACGLFLVIGLYHSATGATMAELKGHTDVVLSVAFSPNGALLASGSQDSTVKVWNVAAGSLLGSMEGHEARVTAVAFTRDSSAVLSCSRDETVFLFNASDMSPRRRFLGHQDDILALAVAPDGVRFCTGAWDDSVRVWALDTDQALLVLDGHLNSVHAVQYSSDGKLILSGGNDELVILWDAHRGIMLMKFEGHEEKVTGVCFLTREWDVFASCAEDGSIRVWDQRGRSATIADGRVLSGLVFAPNKSCFFALADQAVFRCDGS